MEQLFPTHCVLETTEAYALSDPDAPHLRINMVSSIDGTVVVDGKSKPLSSNEDRKVFHALRSMADVILVGAGTARKENYGPVVFSDEIQQLRVSNGLSRNAPVAVVSHSGHFDWESPFFQEAHSKPIIITDAHGAHNAVHGSHYADIISYGEDHVDLQSAINEIYSRGLKHILCEGGPSLNTDLLNAGVVDELCLTLSPVLTNSSTKTIFDGLNCDEPARMEFSHILREGDDIFLRLQNKR